MEFQDITGNKYNRWTVLHKSENKSNRGRWLWVCQCDCGAIREIEANSLKSGNSKSCGCWKRERTSEIKGTHRQSGTRLFNIWCGARKRCENPNSSIYKNYGGRGIQVCKEWQTFEPFYNWAIANGYSEKLSLDRINVNGNYEPSNCRWVTQKQQCNNTRRCRFITINGETHTLKQWGELYGINYSTLKGRIYGCGWDEIKAITTPIIRK